MPWWLAAPRILLEVTHHGPNTFNPTKVNGGSVLKQSAGRSAIF